MKPLQGMEKEDLGVLNMLAGSKDVRHSEISSEAREMS